MVQHKCRKGRKRHKLRNTVQGSILHTRRKGFRRNMDSTLERPVLNKHTNDSHHVPHRHRKVQIS
jgi:hypothetical protein